MWHVSSRSDVATLRTAIHLLLTYLLTLWTHRNSDGWGNHNNAKQKSVTINLLHVHPLQPLLLSFNSHTVPTFRLKYKASPYSITERRVPELIPVLDSQPGGDMSHNPGGKLPLLSARSAEGCYQFAAWWTKARWVWTICLRLLSYCAWIQHANHSGPEPPPPFVYQG